MVTDEYVDGASVFQSFSHALLVPHVGTVNRYLGAGGAKDLVSGFFQFTQIPREDRNSGSLLSGLFSDSEADAEGSSGDEDVAAVDWNLCSSRLDDNVEDGEKEEYRGRSEKEQEEEILPHG